MGNPIHGMAGRASIAAMSGAQDAAPPAADARVKTLYGTRTEELKNMMGRLRQCSSTAQDVVSSRNPGLQ